MAQALVADDILRFVTICRLHDQNGLTISHWRVASIVGTPSDQLAVDHLSTAFGPLVRPFMTETANYVGGTAQILRGDQVLDKVGSAAEAGIGGVDENNLPSQAAGLIKLTTGIAGRKFRGRKYIPFPGTSENENNSVSGAAIILLNGLGDFFASTLPVNDGGGNTCDLIPVLYHRQDKSFTTITGRTSRIYWATQRRRARINQADAVIRVVL